MLKAVFVDYTGTIIKAVSYTHLDVYKRQGRMCYTAGKVMAEKVPSTMGTLMASGLIEAGKELRDTEEMKDAAWIIFFKAYETGVCKRGHAKVGDKTFLDAFLSLIHIFSTLETVETDTFAAAAISLIFISSHLHNLMSFTKYLIAK